MDHLLFVVYKNYRSFPQRCPPQVCNIGVTECNIGDIIKDVLTLSPKIREFIKSDDFIAVVDLRKICLVVCNEPVGVPDHEP